MANPVQQKLFTMRIIWGAMIMSVVLYGVVLFIVQRDQGSTAPRMSLLAVFGIMSVGLAAASWLVPRNLFRAALANKRFDIKEDPLPGAFGQYRQGSPTQRVFAKPEEAFNRALTLFNAPFILSLALADAIGTLGLVVGMIGSPLEMALPFFAVSLALMGSRYPSVSAITEQMEAAVGAKMPD